MTGPVITSVLLALTACGPKPVEVEPFTPAAAATAEANNAREPKVMAVDGTGAHLAALAKALDAEGVSVVLSILEPGATPTSPSLSVAGTTIVDGEVRVTESTITAAGAAPTLPDTGWGGAVGRRAQEQLLGAGLNVKDGAYAAGGSDDDVLMEFKRVPGETTDEALQLRLIRRDDGRILAMVTAPVRGSDTGAWERATDAALKDAARDLLN